MLIFEAFLPAKIARDHKLVFTAYRNWEFSPPSRALGPLWVESSASFLILVSSVTYERERSENGLSSSAYIVRCEGKGLLGYACVTSPHFGFFKLYNIIYIWSMGSYKNTRTHIILIHTIFQKKNPPRSRDPAARGSGS